MVPSSLLQVLIITKNEEANIDRVLKKLTWMEKVIILDSYSSDATISIVNTYPNVDLHYRVFDSFANQCNFGLALMNCRWILSLDADYVLTNEFIDEVQNIINTGAFNISAYFVNFHFLIFGHQLRGNNTTARAVLFQKDKGLYYDDGHAHRLEISGPTSQLKSYILHDDRKSLSVWIGNQDRYSIKETNKLLWSSDKVSHQSFIAKIRKTKIFAPIFIFLYCLFVKGLIFDGWAGWYYTMQRTIVEMLFALRLIEETKFREDGGKDANL